MNTFITPLILISAGTGNPENYVKAVAAAGGASEAAYLPKPDAARFDGLLLTGGGDVDPARYGQENTASVGIDPARDEAEFALINSFLQAGKPILGICRGHQILNVALGGTLIQHLPNAHLHTGKQDLIHPVSTVRGSLLHRLYGAEFVSNSSHHQAVGIPADGMCVTAWSENGAVVEACEHESLPVFSVQFHPERMTPELTAGAAADGLPVIRAFLELCKQ